MFRIISKAFDVIGSPKRSYRIVAALNKSPLRYMVRGSVNILHPQIKLKRRRAIVSFKASRKIQPKLTVLRNQGLVGVDDLISGEQLRELEGFSKDKLKRKEEISTKQTNSSKKFWVRLSDEDYSAADLDSEHPLLKFALQESILELAAQYLGEAPFLNYVLLTASDFNDGPFEKSQLWHLDQDDTKMVKLFVYLSDVTQIEDGPFTFFDRKTSSKIKNKFFKQHLTDQFVARWVDTNKKRHLLGPSLTTFMADTSRCYHMGSRISPHHQRLMYTALYTTVPHMYPGIEVKAFPIKSQLSKMQYLALRMQ